VGSNPTSDILFLLTAIEFYTFFFFFSDVLNSYLEVELESINLAGLMFSLCT